MLRNVLRPQFKAASLGLNMAEMLLKKDEAITQPARQMQLNIVVVKEKHLISSETIDFKFRRFH